MPTRYCRRCEGTGREPAGNSYFEPGSSFFAGCATLSSQLATTSRLNPTFPRWTWFWACSASVSRRAVAVRTARPCAPASTRSRSNRRASTWPSARTDRGPCAERERRWIEPPRPRLRHSADHPALAPGSTQAFAGGEDLGVREMLQAACVIVVKMRHHNLANVSGGIYQVCGR